MFTKLSVLCRAGTAATITLSGWRGSTSDQQCYVFHLAASSTEQQHQKAQMKTRTSVLILCRAVFFTVITMAPCQCRAFFNAPPHPHRTIDAVKIVKHQLQNISYLRPHWRQHYVLPRNSTDLSGQSDIYRPRSKVFPRTLSQTWQTGSFRVCGCFGRTGRIGAQQESGRWWFADSVLKSFRCPAGASTSKPNGPGGSPTQTVTPSVFTVFICPVGRFLMPEFMVCLGSRVPRWNDQVLTPQREEAGVVFLLGPSSDRTPPKAEPNRKHREKFKGKNNYKGRADMNLNRLKHQAGATLHFIPLRVIYGVKEFLSNLNDALLIQQDLNLLFAHDVHLKGGENIPSECGSLHKHKSFRPHTCKRKHICSTLLGIFVSNSRIPQIDLTCCVLDPLSKQFTLQRPAWMGQAHQRAQNPSMEITIYDQFVKACRLLTDYRWDDKTRSRQL